MGILYLHNSGCWHRNLEYCSFEQRQRRDIHIAGESCFSWLPCKPQGWGPPSKTLGVFFFPCVEKGAEYIMWRKWAMGIGRLCLLCLVVIYLVHHQFFSEVPTRHFEFLTLVITKIYSFFLWFYGPALRFKLVVLQAPRKGSWTNDSTMIHLKRSSFLGSTATVFFPQKLEQEDFANWFHSILR